MPKKVGSLERGEIDILSIAAVGFLVFSLVAVISVVVNPKARQIFAPKAVSVDYPIARCPSSASCTYGCKRWDSSGSCSGVCTECNEAPAAPPPPPPSNPPTTVPLTGGYTREQIVNTVAKENETGYDCQGKCATGQDVSGYYKAPNGKYYAIGGTGNDPSRYEKTSLKAVNEAKEYLRIAAEKAAAEWAAKQKADAEAAAKRAEAEAAAASLARQSLIEVSQKGVVSVKSQEGGECDFNSDCGSGSCSGGKCKSGTPGGNSVVTTTTNIVPNQNLASVPFNTSAIQTGLAPTSMNIGLLGSPIIQTPETTSKNITDRSVLTNLIANSMVPLAPTSMNIGLLSSQKQTDNTSLAPTSINISSILSKASLPDYDILTSFFQINPDITRNIVEKYSGTKNTSLSSTVNQTGNTTTLAPTSINTSLVFNQTKKAETTSFRLSDWVADAASNVVSFFKGKPSTSNETVPPNPEAPEKTIQATIDNAISTITKPTQEITQAVTEQPVQQPTQTVTEQPPKSPSPKVVMLGDSITQGYLSASLAEQLKAKGYDIDFLGNQKSVNGISTEGHGGYTTIAIRNSLEAGKWLYQLDKKTGPPVLFDKDTDLVVLELGVNDMGSGFSPDAVTIPNMKYIVNYLRTNVNPNIKVVIAPVPNIYFQDKDHFNEAKYLNGKLTELASEISTSDSPIVMGESITDQYILSQNTQPDGVHPNKAGADKIAESIVNTINNNQLITKEKTPTNAQAEVKPVSQKTSEAFYSQKSPEWQDFKISTREYDKNGNLIKTVKTMAEIGCGPTTVANILKENGINITPVDAAKQILEISYGGGFSSGGSSYNFNIGVLEKYGYTAEKYQGSLDNLPKYMKPTEKLWVSALVKGIPHHTFIDSYTVENGKTVYTMKDPYFTDGSVSKCSATDGGVFSCDNNKGHYNYFTSGMVLEILTPPAKET